MKFIKYFLVPLVVVGLVLLALYVVPAFIYANFVKDGMYVSPYGHFKFKIPSSMSLGGSRLDGRHFVRYVNEWCELYRIDYGEIPEVEKPILARYGKAKFEEYFLRNVYVNMFLQPRLPEGKISVDFVEYRNEIHGGSLYAQLNMPKGSVVCGIHVNGVATGRDDAKRALLVVINNGQTYVITTALNVAATGFGGIDSATPLSRKVWNDALRDELKSQTLEFAKSIQFF